MSRKFHTQTELVNFVVDLEEKVLTMIKQVDEAIDSVEKIIEEKMPIAGRDYFTYEDKVALYEELKNALGKLKPDEQLIHNRLLQELKKFKPEKTIIRKVIKEVPLVTNEIKEVALYEKAEVIRDKLESLPDGEKLKIEAVENLREELDDLKKIRSVGRSFGGVSPAAVKSSITNIDISSQLNGVLKTFSLGQSVHSIMGVHGSAFPFIFRPTVDYTNTGNTITFTSEIEAETTLATGQTIILTVVI